VSIQSSGTYPCLFSNVVEAGSRTGPSKGLFRDLQNALAVPPRVATRFARSSFSIVVPGRSGFER
jgi:hypothetical protein